MPSRRFIRRLPVRAAATTLDVAMTVVKLIAAADLTGNPRTSVRNGMRKMPPPRPRTMPRAPATAPAAKMTAASARVIGQVVSQETRRLRAENRDRSPLYR